MAETATGPTTQQVALPDGRTLDVLLGGDPEGTPLVAHHGTPGCATSWRRWHDACGDAGLRLVAASRPGYATSTRRPGRSVADVAEDTAALLDALGLGTFVAIGASGGGPHTLACAALLPDRCRGAATLAGVGPSDADDLDFLTGMGPENLVEFGAAQQGEEALRAWMAEHGEGYRHVTGEDIVAALGGLLPPVDAAVLTGEFADASAAATRRALEHGFDGWVDDDLAFAGAWGFDPADIAVPVSIWQGDLDLMVPFVHGRWLGDRIPTARAHLVEGHGHLSLGVEHRAEILAELVARAA